MKKSYESPKLEWIKLKATDIICDSRTEGGAGGGDWGGDGDFGEGGGD